MAVRPSTTVVGNFRLGPIACSAVAAVTSLVFDATRKLFVELREKTVVPVAVS